MLYDEFRVKHSLRKAITAPLSEASPYRENIT